VPDYGRDFVTEEKTSHYAVPSITNRPAQILSDRSIRQPLRPVRNFGLVFALPRNSYQSECFSVDRDSRRCSGYVSAQFVDLIHGLSGSFSYPANFKALSM
jgi:hypothetical protein